MDQVESLRATCLNMLLLRGFPCCLPQWIPPVSHITVPRRQSAGPQINISDCIQLSKNRCNLTKRLNLTKFLRSESWNVDILEPTRWFWKAMWIIPLYLRHSRCTINWHHVLAIWQTLRILSCFALPPIYPVTVLKLTSPISIFTKQNTLRHVSPLSTVHPHLYSTTFHISDCICPNAHVYFATYL